MSVNLSNNSNRKYSGPLTIEMHLNADDSIITKRFANVKSLAQGMMTLKDAQVLVQNESDAFTPLNFGAVVKKDGVTLGYLNSNLSTMAKAPYSEKGAGPVIVANSEMNTNELLQMVGRFGGLSKVSVLDLSLPRLNGPTLSKGFKKKVMIVLENGNKSAMEGVSTLAAQSEDSVMIFSDNNDVGLSTAKRYSDSFGDSVTLKTTISGMKNMTFTNTFAKKLKDMTVAIQVKPGSVKRILSRANEFTRSAADFMAAVKSKVNGSNIFSPNLTIQAMLATSAGEMMTLNKAYKDQGKPDHLENKVESGKSLFFQQITDATESTVNGPISLSYGLTGLSLYYFMDSGISQIEDTAGKDLYYALQKRIMKRMKNKFKGTKKSRWSLKRKGGVLKTFKKFNKKLYNKFNDKKFVQVPFDISTSDNDWNDNDHF
jgi:hypothetical protein